MAQLRLGYPEIQKTRSEILQITHNTAQEARRYFARYPIAFPYLCDPDRAVHQRYGIPLEPVRVADVVASTAAVAADFLLRREKSPPPFPAARYPGQDSPQAFVLVDRDGIIRAIHALGPIDRIPQPPELARELAALG